jgi:superfamily I DNA and/or RNA helicase
LGDFISDVFYKPYGESFDSGRVPTDFEHNISGYGNAVAAWVNIPFRLGRESGRQSKKRLAEAKWIAKEARKILDERPDLSVGVITFYSAQVDELMRQMEPNGLTEMTDEGGLRIAESWRQTRDQSGKLIERLRVGTVDAFQGKEFDVVFLSMTRSNDFTGTDEKALRKKFGHLMLENRLCVAMSRQQRLLIVVGDTEMLRHSKAGDAIPGLLKFHELCGGEHGVQLHA